eukprot:736472-Pelagomonas_calceolata.AAC.4
MACCLAHTHSGCPGATTPTCAAAHPTQELGHTQYSKGSEALQETRHQYDLQYVQKTIWCAATEEARGQPSILA